MILENLLMINPMTHDTPKVSKTYFATCFSSENTEPETMRVKVYCFRRVMISRMRGLESIPDQKLNKNDSLTEKRHRISIRE
jgi:hypothetical protein